jgi:hypothetical protein
MITEDATKLVQEGAPVPEGWVDPESNEFDYEYSSDEDDARCGDR